ncbi:class I adenylate-forming enzyme family protein [Streptosporangium sp. LJ11]|uniref:class I adenylate-forming enzyme family protein n=1 Tax=Streptosporangium sp. LJ11 TaxID=3436927 RepID=UPI003F7A799E
MSGPAEPPFPHSLLEALRSSPDDPAFEQGDRIVSRGELLETIRRLAGAMLDAGLGPGRAVAVRTAVSPEAFAAHMAAHALGCRVVGVRPGYPEGHLAHVLGMEVDALLVDRSTVTPELLRAAGPVTLLSLGPCPPPLPASAIDLLADTGTGEGRPLVVAARPDDVAALTFTSGSTGRPKGCAITYRALGEHWSWQPRLWSPVTDELASAFGRYMLFGTLASMVVIEFLGLCLLGGGTAVIPEDDGRPLFPYAIERHRITGSIVTVPRLCQMLDLLRKEPVDVGCLRALMVSGSPLGPGRLAEAVNRLGPVVYQGYGQTEVGLISLLTPGDIAAFPDQALASVGRPNSGVEISVRDEEDREVAVGDTGEIHVRSPYLMSGYWGDPEETRATLRDGRLRTRDLGHLDKEGFLHLAGRTRDVIIVNAIVVYAGAVERVLSGHPDVAEAYVAGAPDELTGEAVHAFVVPAEGAVPDCDALAALVGDELGEGSVPWTITVLPSVPVAASGKPDKRALLELLDPRAL